MATLLKRKSKVTGKLLWTVQVSLDRQGKQRPTIALGNLSKANATTAANNIQSLAASKRAGLPMDGPVADWLSTIDNDLHARLAVLNLCAPRQAADAESQPSEEITLGEFLARYVAERDD